VDLSPKVSRALRSIDGAIVVVDAVEGCQIQTEIVLKQVLKELVQPTLYINKVDRLIKELKLDPDQIQARFQKIIDEFNDLIENYSDFQFQKEWQIQLEKGNVVFGCAIFPNWGISYRKMLQTGLKFKNIYDSYHSSDQLNALGQLHDLIPLSDSIFDMIINLLPNPIKAQGYRIHGIWKESSNLEMNEFLNKCEEKGPTILCINKVMTDKHGGFTCICRVFSGEIFRGMRLYAMNLKKFIQIRDLYIFMGEQRARVERIPCGNIVAFKTMTAINAGETLVQEGYENNSGFFEMFHYISEPILTIALEPKQPSQLEKMLDFLNVMSLNDPSLRVTVNRDTGEYLISGLGELHLDILLKEIEKQGINVIPSRPLVVFRESITHSVSPISSSTKDGLTEIEISIDPLSNDEINLINQGKLYQSGKVFHIESHLNLILDETEKSIQDPVIQRILRKGFDKILKTGPLCDQPVRGLKIKIHALKIQKKQVLSSPLEIQLLLRNVIFASILTGTPILLEPISKLIIQLPLNLIKAVETLVAQKKGKILSIEQIGNSSSITCIIPIKNSLELTGELRSKSSGQAFWQVFFSHWQEIESSEARMIIKTIRMKNGRIPEVPTPDFFLNK